MSRFLFFLLLLAILALGGHLYLAAQVEKSDFAARMRFYVAGDGAEQGPFIKDLREVVMLVREPDSELLARLTLLQRDFNASQLRAVPCPAQ